MRSSGAAPHSIPSDIDPLNGRLHFTLPIYSAALDGGFSYSLGLAYNSTVWKGTYDNETDYPTNPTTAGLGFTMHFGRIYLVDTKCDDAFFPGLFNCPPEGEPDLIIARHWYYEDAAGLSHELFPSSPMGFTPWRTHDGSNVRARMIFDDSLFAPWDQRDIDEWDLWTEDGTYYRFHQELAENLSTDGHYSFLVSDIVPGISPGGVNSLHITYHATYHNHMTSITDNFGRTISFGISATVDGVTVSKGVVASITVPAFDGTTATYALDYDIASLTNPKTGAAASNQVLLVSLTPPAGASFSTLFSYSTSTQPNKGVLASLRIPTGAITEYKYGVIDYLRNGWHDCEFSGASATCEGTAEWEYTYGVIEKRLLLPDGSPTYLWTYARTKLQDDGSPAAGVTKTQITDPFGNATLYKFSSAPETGDAIPLDGVLERVEYYHGQVSPSNLSATELFQYEYTTPPSEVGLGARAWGIRISERRYVDASAPASPRKVTYSDWDGHRWELESHHDFDGSVYRTIQTESYNPSGITNQALLWVPQIRRLTDSSGTSLLVNAYTHTPDGRLLTDKHTRSDTSSTWIRSTYSYNATTGNLASDSTAFKDTASSNDLPPTSSRTYTYQWGGVNSQAFTGVDWKSSDLTIDKNTGLPVSVRDSAGIQTDYLYDSQGRVTSIIQPGAEVDSLITYPTPNEVRVQTGVPNTSDYSLSVTIVDGLGRTSSVRKTLVQGTGAIQFFQYEGPSSLLASQSEWLPCNSVSTGSGCTNYLQIPSTQYDYTYPVASPAGTSTVDPFGRVQKITLADTSYVTFSYSGLGYSKTLHNLNNAGTPVTTAYEYDAMGRLSAVIPETDGAKALYFYDELDRLTKVELHDQHTSPDPIQVRTWNYDGVHPELMSSSSTPEEGSVQYNQYTADGWLKEDLRPDGTHHYYDYDLAGRLQRETVSKPGVSPTVPREFWYQNTSGTAHGTGALGRLIEEKVYDDAGTNPSITKEYHYNGLNGRLNEERVYFGFWSHEATVDPNTDPPVSTFYAHNNRGLVSEIKYPKVAGSSKSPTTIQYTYSQGLLSSVQYNRGSADPNSMMTLVSSIAYGSAGEVTALSLANGTTELTDHDLLTRPARLKTIKGTDTLWDSGAYVYDGAQNIRSIGSQTYQYDLVGRLTNSSTLSPVYGSQTLYSQQYTYDAFGSMQSRTNAAGESGTQIFDVDPNNNRLESLTVESSTILYEYTTNGAVKSDALHRFDYDAAERLRVLKTMDQQVMESYDYDTSNWRVRISSSDMNHQTVFVREPAGKVLSEFARPSSTKDIQWRKDYIYLFGRLLATVENTEPNTPNPVSSASIQLLCPNGVCLSWPQVTGPDILGYDIYRAPAADPNAFTLLSGLVPGTSFVDSSVSTSSTYFYKLVAVDSAGLESSPTSPRKIKVADQTNPSLPDWFIGERFTCATISLSWPEAVDSDSSVAGYNLYRREVGEALWPASPRNGSALISGLSYLDSASAGGPFIHEGPYEYGIEVVDAAGRKSTSYLAATVEACEPGGGAQLVPFDDGEQSPYRAIGDYSGEVAFRVRFHHVDHLGTPRLTTSETGIVLGRSAVFPFGEEVPGSSFGSRHRFTGHERDSISSQDYMLARSYQYQTARFSHVDPSVSAQLEEPGSWNAYSYVANNPVSYADPLGLFRIGGALGRVLDWASSNFQGQDVTLSFGGAPGVMYCNPYAVRSGTVSMGGVGFADAYDQPLGIAMNTHDFYGGSDDQIAEAYRRQEALRQSLTSEIKNYFSLHYGMDLDQMLRPGHGKRIKLSNIADHGLYNPFFNTMKINARETSLDVFDATVIHETEHWAQDRAKLFGFHRPYIHTLALKVYAEHLKVGFVESKWHGPYGWSAELVQFGKIIW